VNTKYIVADFGGGKEIYDEIRQQLQLLDIGVLINNVGRMYDFPDELDNISEELIWQIININVGAVTMMSRIVIPQMKINKRGIIVNVSSGSECQPAPLMTVYASTKVYVKNFTLGELHNDD
jgi:17beta-estradiol 17-dehydrogenase / very-long-chain 3-oxoacyl-CoA reductase